LNRKRNREKPREKCPKDGTEYIKGHGCPVCKKKERVRRKPREECLKHGIEFIKELGCPKCN